MKGNDHKKVMKYAVRSPAPAVLKQRRQLSTLELQHAVVSTLFK